MKEVVIATSMLVAAGILGYILAWLEDYNKPVYKDDGEAFSHEDQRAEF